MKSPPNGGHLWFMGREEIKLTNMNERGNVFRGNITGSYS
jgi:hypothetical protein